MPIVCLALWRRGQVHFHGIRPKANEGSVSYLTVACHCADRLLSRLRTAGQERSASTRNIAGRDVGFDRLPGLLQARLFSRGIGGLALAGCGADGVSTGRREKKTAARCFPTPATSRGIHPESSPPEASIGGVGNKNARRSSCVATQANGLRTSLARPPADAITQLKPCRRQRATGISA